MDQFGPRFAEAPITEHPRAVGFQQRRGFAQIEPPRQVLHRDFEVVPFRGDAMGFQRRGHGSVRPPVRGGSNYGAPARGWISTASRLCPDRAPPTSPPPGLRSSSLSGRRDGLSASRAWISSAPGSRRLQLRSTRARLDFNSVAALPRSSPPDKSSTGTSK